ncbi:conserved hypothetical protein [Pediculus humanus corporis]|uniref:Uncharacterized protein n=1 Tax=Pediculus humanus subsp. corporis TaxID=121224 RepID=E0VZK4_PEDHC|nr:uncharacterized protein Phum_PHUM535130 [Pediculus humanus corporis]EEB18810.1 conserved hypothetical protein [Pediculus humanus corporis]
MNLFFFIVLALTPIIIIIIKGEQIVINRESDFVKIFSKCRKGSPDFDECIKNGVNAARPYFKTGVKEFNIPPFDPFYAEEVVQVRGSHGLYYKLTIRNVYERGWTNSHVYKFQSDLNNQLIRYHQFFPAKYLDGSWEIETNIFKPYKNSGTFNLGLFNYTQVTTAGVKKGYHADPNAPFHVRIQALQCGNMELHIKNLIPSWRSSGDQFVDSLIRIGWKPGFELSKPIIDDLVSTAFTKIFNDAFKNFPFDKFFN